MEKSNLLSKYQSCFRKNFSCETAVNYVINKWRKIYRNKELMTIFLDFKRGFETIDRDILLCKMYKYGTRDKELNWFKSYLSNRNPMIKLNDRFCGLFYLLHI